MNILQKRDVTPVAAILLLVAVAFGISHYIRRTPVATARVSVDGTIVEALDLNKDAEVTITSPSGGTDHLVIKDGEIWYSEAGYPDKICVHQRKKRLNSDTIVCLPNQMIVTIAGGE